MVTKSIITELGERQLSGDGKTQWIKAKTLDGSDIVFWGNKASCVNLASLEQQETPLLVRCSECERNSECPQIYGSHYSIPETAVVTIFPYRPDAIRKLLDEKHGKDAVVELLSKDF